jgi:hypothetical protein
MSIPFSSVKSKIGLDDILTFGKHEGSSVLHLIHNYPAYIPWLMDNTSLRFYPSVMDEIRRTDLFKKIDKSYIYDGRLRGDLSHHMAEAQAAYNDWDDDIPF